MTALRPDRDIRIQHHPPEIQGHSGCIPQITRQCTGLGIVEPVEPSYLIGTVIIAVPGPDTAVVNHLVQSLAALVGGRNGTNIFTGRIVAMLAHNRLEQRLPESSSSPL